MLMQSVLEKINQSPGMIITFHNVSNKEIKKFVNYLSKITKIHFGLENDIFEFNNRYHQLGLRFIKYRTDEGITAVFHNSVRGYTSTYDDWYIVDYNDIVDKYQDITQINLKNRFILNKHKEEEE